MSDDTNAVRSVEMTRTEFTEPLQEQLKLDDDEMFVGVSEIGAGYGNYGEVSIAFSITSRNE